MKASLVLHGTSDPMPVLGLGTWQVQDCASLVTAALRLGYRHIDTARSYGNESDIGAGIRASGVPRQEIFLTTKVWHEDLAAGPFARSVEASLKALHSDYVDLLLVHWPSTANVRLEETMQALSEARRRGLAANIGVANFNVAMVEEALSMCPSPIAVLQAEYHPYLDQSRVLAACRQHGIAFTAYCPLGRGRLISDDTLTTIARTKHRTVAQITLRWLLQQGVAAVPRTSHPERLAENLNVFDFNLTEAQMEQINSMKRADGRIVNPAMAPAWD